MFTTIVITLPVAIADEGRLISQLLMRGDVDLVHIRKPDMGLQEMERVILSVPEELHSRLVLHDHFALAERYGLYGVHLNSRNPTPPASWGGSVSRSCHSMTETAQCKDRYDYVSLSPIFDSISKKGYMAAFTHNDISEAAASGIIDHKVFALGGVTFDRLDEVRAMGFGGAMILGDAWKRL